MDNNKRKGSNSDYMAMDALKEATVGPG